MLGSSRTGSTENNAFSSTSSGASAKTGAHGNGGAGSGRSSTRYEVQERLGEGALWIAYRVRPATSVNGRGGAPSQSLCLKALRGAANRHPRLANALDAQALRWRDLLHPHIAPTQTWGFESGTYYFTTALLLGGSLQTRLARGPLPPDEAMQLLRGLASALSALHPQNLVHGDVRPRQILFDASGFPLLTDGGHAQALCDAGLALADLQPDAALYLAPERSSGEAPNPAADIYSLGATFYAAITGRAPFEGSSPLAIAARHRHETPALPSTLNPHIPREWDDLLLHLLDKDPAQRPNASALERLIAPAPPPRAAQKNVVAATPTTTLADTSKAIANGTPSMPTAVTTSATAGATTAPGSQIALSVEERQKARRRHGWREFGGMAGALACLLLLVGGGVGAAFFAYNSVENEIPQEVKVPKYLGLSQDKAKTLLAQKGLVMKVVRESYDPKVPQGTIMDGDPSPDRPVRAGREVFVTISAGPAPIKMVDFSQLTLDQARAIILQHGMKLGSIAEQYDEKTPRGAILGQYPQPGDAFSRSQPITLIVSRGAQPKEIDAQNGEPAPVDPLDTIPTTPNQTFDTGDTFAPLEPATNTTANGAPNATRAPAAPGLETKTAVVRVSIPRGGGTQLVRIIVADANGERTVYQKARRAGAQFQQKVTVARAPGQEASVKVFIGDQLATEQTV